jgi:hypothetical protein
MNGFSFLLEIYKNPAHNLLSLPKLPLSLKHHLRNDNITAPRLVLMHQKAIAEFGVLHLLADVLGSMNRHESGCNSFSASRPFMIPG